MRENDRMEFDLPALLAAHRGDGYELYGRYLNPQQPRVLHAIGFDQVYERARGRTCTTRKATPTPTSWPGSACSRPAATTR